MALFRVAIRGTLNASETFQFGFHVTDGLLIDASAQDVADSVRDSFSDQWDVLVGSQTPQSIYPTTTVFTGVTAYELDEETGSATDVAEAGFTGVAGTSSNPALPPNVAMCVSLLTGAPGRSKRGRLYMPAPQRDIVATGGLIPAVTQTTLATFWRETLEGINGGTLGFECVVYSRALSASRRITQVRVGQVFDSQERRRRSLVDTGVSLDVSL